MTDTPVSPKKIDWKWVAIALVMYIFFYFLPILTAFGAFSPQHTGRFADIFLGIWMFGGIIIIAAVAGYISKGITIWEPAIAASLLVVSICGYGAVRILSMAASQRVSTFKVLLPMLIITITAFLLSLLGAAMGEYAQKILRPEKPSETASDIQS